MPLQMAQANKFLSDFLIGAGSNRSQFGREKKNMKITPRTLFSIILVLATSCILPSTAECDETDEPKCLAEHKPCTDNPEGCCDGLGCFGYNFFKRCQQPPACLPHFNDCSSGMECCDGMVCAITNSGGYECQEKTIKTVVANEDETPTPAPTKTPIDEKNLRTTKIPGQPVTTNVGCSVGDPHIYTFDGLAHDCQAEGEFVLAKSTVTQRQIQARFAHFADRFSAGNAWSVTKGVAIQDEGDTPLVQFNVPVLESSLAPNTIGTCRLQFFVDGVQRDLDEGSGQDDKVLVTYNHNGIDVFYVESEMKVTVSFGDANGCFLNVCLYLPDTDPTVGLLGSADGDVWNDWVTSDGEALLVPKSLDERMRVKGYDYCTTHWCLRSESDSLFTYAELGIDFEDIMHCDLPFGNTMDEFFVDVDQEILDFCGEELMCILDAQMGGLQTARDTSNARLPVQDTCNGAGGECNVASCCDGLQCVEVNGFAKQCEFEVPQCAGEWASCANKPCCDDLLCEQLNDGRQRCRDLPECMPEWRDCSQIGCCGDMTCVTRPDGKKQCRDLPQCMPMWQDCSLGVDCCDGLKCHQENDGRQRCVEAATCVKEWKDCSDESPCCDGLTCIEDGPDRHICRKLPECVREWHSCKYVGCCQDGPKPLKCFNFVDANGREASQCQSACANNWNTCSDEKPCCNNDHTCKDNHGKMQCVPN